jgi:nitroreductase
VPFTYSEDELSTFCEITRAAIAQLLQTRRTIHEFKPELPPRKVVVDAIDAARWAPNHRVTEPWRFYLLGRETANAIADYNAEMIAASGDSTGAEKKRQRWRAMPGWLVLTCAVSDDPVRSREDYAACCCAAQNMMLYLWSAGVGAKWNTGRISRDPRLYELIGADAARESVVGIYWYGYPAEIPNQRRKPVDSILCEVP